MAAVCTAGETLGMSSQEFASKLQQWFQDKGISSNVEAYLRQSLYHTLQPSNFDLKETHKVISPKIKTIDWLILDHLKTQNYHYTLSVFSSEADLHKQFTSDHFFSTCEVRDFLDVLSVDSETVSEIITEYFKGNGDSLLTCTLQKLSVLHCQNHQKKNTSGPINITEWLQQIEEEYEKKKEDLIWTPHEVINKNDLSGMYKHDREKWDGQRRHLLEIMDIIDKKQQKNECDLQKWLEKGLSDIHHAHEISTLLQKQEFGDFMQQITEQLKRLSFEQKQVKELAAELKKTKAAMEDLQPKHEVQTGVTFAREVPKSNSFEGEDLVRSFQLEQRVPGNYDRVEDIKTKGSKQQQYNNDNSQCAAALKAEIAALLEKNKFLEGQVNAMNVALKAANLSKHCDDIPLSVARSNVPVTYLKFCEPTLENSLSSDTDPLLNYKPKIIRTSQKTVKKEHESNSSSSTEELLKKAQQRMENLELEADSVQRRYEEYKQNYHRKCTLPTRDYSDEFTVKKIHRTTHADRHESGLKFGNRRTLRISRSSSNRDQILRPTDVEVRMSVPTTNHQSSLNRPTFSHVVGHSALHERSSDIRDEPQFSTESQSEITQIHDNIYPELKINASKEEQSKNNISNERKMTCVSHDNFIYPFGSQLAVTTTADVSLTGTTKQLENLSEVKTNSTNKQENVIECVEKAPQVPVVKLDELWKNKNSQNEPSIKLDDLWKSNVSENSRSTDAPAVNVEHAVDKTRTVPDRSAVSKVGTSVLSKQDNKVFSPVSTIKTTTSPLPTVKQSILNRGLVADISDGKFPLPTASENTSTSVNVISQNLPGKRKSSMEEKPELLYDENEEVVSVGEGDSHTDTW